MSWQPDGPWERVEKEATLEGILAAVNPVPNPRHGEEYAERLKAFLVGVREDGLRRFAFEEGNHNRRYWGVGYEKDGKKVEWCTSVMMS